jgi:D-alanyl-D-alanine carboxypeptidase (penicillin-binding protein 5/6)
VEPATGGVGRGPLLPGWAWAVLTVSVVLAAVGVVATILLEPSGETRQTLRALTTVRSEDERKPERPKIVYGVTPAPPEKRVDIRLRTPPSAGLLIDLDTGEVLWERRPTVRRPIASLTKIMTALIVTDTLAPRETVRISKRAVHFEGSGTGMLRWGKRIQAEKLLYALLIPSGNDAAIALAEGISGSVENFVTLMNRRAREMGLRCTRFASPHGLVDENAYSCTRDLAILTREAMKRARIRRVVRREEVQIPFPVKGGKLWLYTTNPLIQSDYRGVTGLKTGYTDPAGSCLIATATRGKTRLAVILLNSPDTGLQARRILDRGFWQLKRARARRRAGRA